MESHSQKADSKKKSKAGFCMDNQISEKNLFRLNKFLARWAGVSRRQAENMVKKGKVFVNGKKISELAVFVDPKKDSVRINKKKVYCGKASPIYLMFNKPPKVLSSSADPKGRPIVMDYIERQKERLFLVGRLDWDSEGLLILTNDGDFASNVLHPKNKIPKSYLVKVKGCPADSRLKKMMKGVSTPIGKRKALFVGKMRKKSPSNSWLRIILTEGKNRQIRLMCEAIGHPVQQLKRTAIGRLKLNKLAKGAVLPLRERDIKKVFQWPKELKNSFKGRSKPNSRKF